MKYSLLAKLLNVPQKSFSANDLEYGGFRDYEATGDDVLGSQKLFYQDHFGLGTNDPYAYSMTVFESSPLNRIMEQGSPGEPWQPDEEIVGSTEHVQRFNYGSNSSTDVRYYYVTSDNLAGGTTYYSADELYKSTFEDEDGNKTEEFKDKLDRVVLKRSFDGSINHSTYYVYDDFGLLRFVIPPEAEGDSDLPTSTEISQLCYQYNYDERRRIDEKKLPGVDTVYMIYDNRDRLVATQDGEMRINNEWLITKYDHLNRPVITGLFETTSSFNTMKTMAENITDFTEGYVGNTANDLYGYDKTGWPSSLTTDEIRTVMYYDNYDFEGLPEYTGPTFDPANKIDNYSDNDGNSGYFDLLKGQVTGSATLVLDGTGLHWIHQANYYDNKYRLIQSRSSLYPSGTGMTSKRYNFVGNVLESLDIQNVNNVENRIRYSYNYDHAGRLTNTFVNLNNEDAVLLSQNKYNELGELKEKNLHSENFSTFLQSVDYKYNIRGWLTQINDPDNLGADNDYFGMNLFFASPDVSLGADCQYNGNISAISWKTGDNPDNAKAYSYSYDELNRILRADQKEKPYGYGYWSDVTRFDVEDISYDLNGNIVSLLRKNSTGTIIDELDYGYIGNQLTYVDDDDATSSNSLGFFDGWSSTTISNPEYGYDNNGNMTLDKNRNIIIIYNYLNLPEQVYPDVPPPVSDEIKFIYDATGVKWQKIATVNDVTEKTTYNGSFIYKGAIGSRELDYVLTPEGMIKSSATPVFHYFLKDHLGNTRATIADLNANGWFDISTEVLQTADYYPFGMQHFTQGGENKYLFNGKELQDEQLGNINLDWYDYGARFYDPALGRFSTVDPALELYYDWSPYNYVGNNPIRRTDPTGMTWADSTAAEDLKASASRQIEQYEKSNERKGERMANANDKGKYGRARRLQKGINRNNSAIGQLEASISQIDEMGANQNYTFEFQSVSGDGPHYVTQASNGNIVIQHSSTALQLHETRHAYQYMTDKGNNFTWDSQNRLAPTRSYKGMVNWGLSEQSAYRVQYAYNPSSMSSSSYGSPSIYLNYKWVGGIRGGSYNKFLPYMKQYELINRMLYRKQQMDFYNGKL